MKVIKELKILLDPNNLFQIPTDTRVNDLVVYTYEITAGQWKSQFIIDYLRDNPVSKYPLIKNYHVFYNSIIKEFIENKKGIDEADWKVIQSLDPKYCYENLDKMGDSAIDNILNSPRYSFKYIRDVVYKSLIKDNSHSTAIKILESKYYKFLKIIFADPDSSYSYVRDIIADVYSPAEETIFSGSDDNLKFQYIVDFEYQSILKKNKYDYDKTKSEIKNKYDKKFYFLIKNKEISNFRVIADYLKKTLDEPDSKIEDLMVGQGSQHGYYSFLRGYYLKLETIKDENDDQFKKLLKIKDIFKEKHPRFIDNIDYEIKFGSDY